MEDDQLVSIVIPTYKRTELVKRAVKSVLEQTYENIEVIVVNDDPGTDLSELSNQYSVQLINHQENRGACEARNTGIKEANGEFIGLLDDDDEYKPEKIEKQVKQFRSLTEDYGMVYSGVEEIENGEVVNKKIRPGRRLLSRKREGQIYQELLRGNMIPAPTVLLKKECFEKVGLFDSEFESAQDLDMWLRIAKEYKIGKLDEALAVYHLDGEDRISESLEKVIQGRTKILEKYSDDLEKNFKARLALKSIIKTSKIRKKHDFIFLDYIMRALRSLGIAFSRIGR